MNICLVEISGKTRKLDEVETKQNGTLYCVNGFIWDE